jgi:spore germination protein YaaH
LPKHARLVTAGATAGSTTGSTTGRRWAALVGVLALVGAALTTAAVVSPRPAHASSPQREASGWITYWNSAGSTEVDNNADLFSDVSEFWFHATSATSIVPSGTAPDSQLSSSIAAIRSRGVPVTITVTDGTGSGVMASILSNATTRVQHEQALMALALKYGASGIDLDYENMAVYADSNTSLTQPTRAGFDALVHEMAVALHARGMILAVDVMSKTSEPGTSPAGQVYDYPTLGQWVDRFRIMTYDQHWSGSSYPGGPISSVPWAESIIKFAVTVVPAAKIYMGVPLYGYDWPNNGNHATGLTFTQVQNLISQYHATRQWSATDGEPHFSYTDGAGVQHSVWYNDAEALQARIPLVGKYGLGGVAFWSFGNEDPGIWQVMRTFMYGPNPFGNLEGAVLWPGGVRVRGWAIDPNSTDGINVDLYADGKFLERVMANGDRPDVGNIYFAYGTTHGFDTVLSLPAGQHTICAYGINVAAGDSNPKLGCMPATVPTNNPVGHFESTSGGAGVLTVGGWALDPDTAAPIDVHVYVDGRWAGMTTASGNRPDVGAAYAGWGAAHGFTTSVNVSGGTHKVCIYGINVGLGTSNPQLGCATVTVSSGNPFGNVEAATASPGALTVRGWTIDPNTANPIAVAVYVDGRLLTNATANAARPDVAAVYPWAGANHGFSVTANASAGTHQVCVYGINTGPGDANPVLGCKTVTVPSGNPFGNLDQVVGGAGGLTATGWAIDPNTSSSIEVAIYVDGAFALQQTANASRPDVGAAYPSFGSAHGYSLPVSTKAGKHTVCAFGINTGPGDTNTLLGCKAVTTS